MAEFLHILAEQYDYSQLAEEILRFESVVFFVVNEANFLSENSRIKNSIQMTPGAPSLCLHSS